MCVFPCVFVVVVISLEVVVIKAVAYLRQVSTISCEQCLRINRSNHGLNYKYLLNPDMVLLHIQFIKYRPQNKDSCSKTWPSRFGYFMNNLSQGTDM